MTDTPPAETRRPSRLWVVPPGLMSHDEPFEGYRVLDEVRSALGVTLWQFLRDTDLWSTTRPHDRGRLFVTGLARRRLERLATIGTARELRGPLEIIGRALDGRTRNAGPQVTLACHTLSRWAADQGLPHTALAFAQSGALATPEEPGPAYIVGLLARRNAEYRRAETWFRRALALGRRAGDWRHYGLACIGLGNLYRQRGDYPTARVWFVKALRIARRRGLYEVRPMAMHDLFCIAMNGGHNTEAEQWAKRAFRAYGPRHARLLALAHDVARFWLVERRYEEALRVFRAVLPHVDRVAERRVVMANLARAAAGLGDRLSFAAMWSETWRLVDEYEDSESVAEALAILAEGAAAIGDPDRAQLAATHAVKMARQRNESEHRLTAERVLDSLRTIKVGVVNPPPPPAPEPVDDEAAAAAEPSGPDFAERLVVALSAGIGPEFTE